MGKNFCELQKTWRKNFLQNQNNLFVDEEFPPTERSLVFTGHHKCSSDLHKNIKNCNVEWRRATEICQPRKPQLVVKDTTLFDLNQGRLGNCWYIAGAAHLAIREDLFRQIVPSDQDFEDRYAGLFHFFFWRFGKWVEVIIDDYLPCYCDNGRLHLFFLSNKREPNEFWAALLEKAYAKLHTCYEALEGGFTDDAMVDISGGIGYKLKIAKGNPNLFEQLQKSFQRDTLFSCAIYTAKRVEEQRSDGLVALHAYTITNVAKVVGKGNNEHRLVRVRNPWGCHEWNGKWSDSDRKSWNSIDEATRNTVLNYNGDDGEFWMDYNDFIGTFEEIQMCFIPPLQQIPKQKYKELNAPKEKKEWNQVMYPEGSWVRGVTAGGPYPGQEFWKNPQYVIDVKDPDLHDQENKATIIVSLMKFYSRKLELEGNYVGINFDIFEVNDHEQLPLTNFNFKKRSTWVCSCEKTHLPYREVTLNLKVTPGRYYIIPSADSTQKEAKFLLRVFTEAPVQHKSLEDETTPIEINPETDPNVIVNLFQKYAGEDNVLDARELQLLLNEGFLKDWHMGRGFDLESCRSLIASFDDDFSGRMELNEAVKMWSELMVWKKAFSHFDKDQSGNIDNSELKSLFRSIGFSVSNKVTEVIIRRYSGKTGKIAFSDFILTLTKLVTHMKIFPKYSGDGGLKSKAEFTLDEYMANVLYI